jgi:CRISPR-associated endonuclease/helicase Cas3
LGKGEKKAGRAVENIHSPEILVGARRVHEREAGATRLRELGFIGEKQRLQKRAFLIATSAGEVGVDIDADHMVSDLVPWERMVQRLGRVNRRGEGNAQIKVFWREPLPKKPDAPSEADKRVLLAFKSKAVFGRLPRIDDAFDASPGALRRLAENPTTRPLIEAATTPEPLRPALSRPLVDAWSMTSLEAHTGRPEVTPWLRGWEEEERPETTVIWREHIPVPIGADDLELRRHKAEIEDFFQAAPPHESEKLGTETYRVATWMQERARRGAGPQAADRSQSQ